MFGGAGRPASSEQVKAKFRANAQLCLNATAVAGLEHVIIDTLERHAAARVGEFLASPAVNTSSGANP